MTWDGAELAKASHGISGLLVRAELILKSADCGLEAEVNEIQNRG